MVLILGSLFVPFHVSAFMLGSGERGQPIGASGLPALVTSGLGSPCFSREPGLNNRVRRSSPGSSAPACQPGSYLLVERRNHSQCSMGAKMRVTGPRAPGWSTPIPSFGLSWDFFPKLLPNWALRLSRGTLELRVPRVPSLHPFKSQHFIEASPELVLTYPPASSLAPPSSVQKLPKATSSPPPCPSLFPHPRAPGGVATRPSRL